MSSRRSARLSAALDAAAAKKEAAAAAATHNVTSSVMPPPATAPSRKRKSSAVASKAAAADDDDVPDAAPSTPQKRRTQKTAPPPPPATPTPSAVGLIAEGVKGTTSKPQHARVARVARPDRTNATLLSPETSRVIAPAPAVPAAAVSPSKPPRSAVAPPPPTTTTTTATLLDEACAHLIKVDPRMGPLIRAHHCRIFSPDGLAEEIDPFESLASGIISQQVSGAAAKAIKRRFIELFSPPLPPPPPPSSSSSSEMLVPAAANAKVRFPHPSEVAAASIEKLRSAGLSQRKAEYVQGLADKFRTGELSAQLLADAPYDEVLDRLIAVRGLGRWSVEMFACFGLKRLDVFSVGDLGVQRGMAAFAGRDVAKLKNKGGKWKYMAEADMEAMAEPFRPYRSLFMWYMWRVEETDVSTME